MHAVDQRLLILGGTGIANRLAVALQRRQQHAQHIRRQVGLAGGQAQSLFGIQHLELVLRRDALGRYRDSAPPQRQAGPFQHHLGQLPLADRLGQIIVQAALQQRSPLVGERVGSKRDDGQRRLTAFELPATDRLGGLPAVHAGHLHVQQHQLHIDFQQRLQRRLPRIDRQHLPVAIAQQRFHGHQVRLAVIDDQ